MKPGYDMWKYMMSEMPTPYPDISQQMVFASDWEEFDEMKYQDILKKESDVDSKLLIFNTIYL